MPTKRLSRADVDTSRIDWSRFDATTDEEIDAQIKADPDTAPAMASAEGWAIVRNLPVPDVKAIRSKLKVSQAQFANAYGFSRRTLQEWEQQRSVPEPHTRVFLRVIEQYPEIVRAVAEAMTGRPEQVLARERTRERQRATRRTSPASVSGRSNRR